MYLSKLEIVGFKSFAQKTALKFNGGISAIVGPNGCGKSNIVDAIRWVLGEQKTSVLRSDVMENVIFNGTKDRKPLSMAEVSLTIENNKGVLPTEYSEVTITRRLFRSGESEYLLNKNKCRLKDIIDLFMDTGLGADSYSVIELKMVEAILSGRAEERRALFEEAAGIKKYKLRRKEAAKKLESVVADLVRLQDILDEVRKNTNSLSRQAQKTRRYNTLMTELKGLEIQMLDYQYDILSKNAAVISSDMSELDKQKIKIKSELYSIEEVLLSLQAKHNQAEAEFAETHTTENVLLAKISQYQRDIAVDTEKLASLDKSKERIESEIADAELRLDSTETELHNIASQVSDKESTIAQSELQFDELKAVRDKAATQLREIKSEVDKANETAYSLQSAINNLKSQENRSIDRKQMLERKIQGSFEESHRLQSQIDEINEELDKAGDTKLSLAEELAEAENLLSVERERQSALQTNIDSLKLKINEKKHQLGSKNSALDFLKSMIDTNETAKYLFKSDNWCNSSEKIQLAEAIAVDDEYRTATLSVLNYIGDFFLVDSITEAKKALQLLQDDKKGRTAIIAKELIQQAPSKAISGKSLFDVIRCDNSTAQVLQNILGSCLIVDNLDAAISAVQSGNCDYAVAMSGELVHKSGYILGGSFQKSDSGKLGKKEKMDSLKKEIVKINSDVAELDKQFDGLKFELSGIDIQSLTANVRSAETQLKSFEQKTAQAQLRRQALEQSLQLVSESNTRIDEEIADISIDIENFASQIAESAEKHSEVKQNLSAVQAQLAEAETELRQKEENLRAIEIDLTRLRSELSSLKNEQKKMLEQAMQLRSTIQRKHEELLNSDSQKSILAGRIDTNNSELSEVQSELDKITSKMEILVGEKNSLSEQLAQYNHSLTDYRKTYDSLKESIYNKEIKQSEINLQISSIREKMASEHQINLDEHISSVPENFDYEHNKSAIIDIKQKLSNLGNINFLALEEFEKESERLSFYENQVNDLYGAEKTLKETIAEINQTAERQFADTFGKIHANFQHLFKTLFGNEGKAELRINEGKLLETDIEIIAEPPNKRPNSIEQLSGGEKTLTAIALLFAIYLVKPSPFCILDEVDAPLDDANIDKFINLIKEFSENTQFLIVSHNKKTMTAANTLYGITMQEVGVSKTVSVSLNQDAEVF